MYTSAIFFEKIVYTIYKVLLHNTTIDNILQFGEAIKMTKNSGKEYLDNLNSNLIKASGHLGLEPWLVNMMTRAERKLHVDFPVPMDDGSVQIFSGFRVQDCTARGPAKGGIRYHWNVDQHEVRALARDMTHKCALMNIPLGGGKGGLICDPKGDKNNPNGTYKPLSEGELERMTRAYTRAIAHIIGPLKDIPAPDVNTTPQIMDWLMDEYSKVVAEESGMPYKKIYGVVTGKPVGNGGSLGRGRATARGMFFTLREAAKDMGLDLSTATTVVQGFGNAGMNFAKFVYDECGTKVIAVSDSQGGIYLPSGLNPYKVEEWKNDRQKNPQGSVIGFPGTQTITDLTGFLSIPCDVLAPSALEGVLTNHTTPLIKTKVVVEGANGATTNKADEIMFQKGIYRIPGILANGGGVTVSCKEWEQNLRDEQWTEERIDNELEIHMVDAYRATKGMETKYNISPGEAVYVVSVDRVAKAIKNRLFKS